MSINQENLPVVSIIIPIYNMEKFLGETIESVLASSYHAFEIVLMDDGSSDSSLDIAKVMLKKIIE